MNLQKRSCFIRVNEKTKAIYRNLLIKEIIVYKESIACVIAQYPESFLSLRYLSLENQQWLNAGEDSANSVPEARQKFMSNAVHFLDYRTRIAVLARQITNLPTLVSFLKKQSTEPKEFVLSALESHELVIFGEVHLRMWSWNLCKNILTDKRFAHSTGTIFMEISAHLQKTLDAFLAGETRNDEMILDVLRELESNGWHDRGMFEFICEVWELNRTLTPEKKLKIIAADIPRPFSTFKTLDEQKSHFASVPDRNAFMASKVERQMQTTTDRRHCLFIVGTGHAYKSSVPGFAASSQKQVSPGRTAGSILSTRLPKEKVFTIFTHMPIMENSGLIHGRLRKGLFDSAFRELKNRPLAFRLKNSPFGKEPFDALPEVCFNSFSGTYSDNYDGYIFLGSLDEEPGAYILYDL